MFKILSKCSEYTPNNIEYRVVTSRQLAKYKIQQSLVLSEIINNAPNHTFSPTAKEIVLSKYNFWFIFALWLENYLLKVNSAKEKLSDKNYEEIKNVIVEEAKRIVKNHDNLILSLIEQNPKELNKDFYNMWKELHNSQIFTYLLKVIKETYLATPSNYFSRIIEELINILALTVYEVYELDYLTLDKSKNIIIYVDETHFKIDKDLEVLINKVKYFEEHFDISKDKIIVKVLVPVSVVYHTKFYDYIKKEYKKIVIE